MTELKRTRSKPIDSYVQQSVNALRSMATILVTRPDDVKVSSTLSDAGTMILTLWVADGDVGLVIGTGGRNIQAMRTILVSAAARNHVRLLLEIVQPNVGQVSV